MRIHIIFSIRVWSLTLKMEQDWFAGGLISYLSQLIFFPCLISNGNISTFIKLCLFSKGNSDHNFCGHFFFKIDQWPNVVTLYCSNKKDHISIQSWFLLALFNSILTFYWFEVLSLVNPASTKVVVGDLEYCCYVVMWPLPGPPRSPAPPCAAPSDAALSLRLDIK